MVLNKAAHADAAQRYLTILSVNNSVGGINPMMCASSAAGNGGECFDVIGAHIITASLCVGNRCIESTQATIAGVAPGGLGTSITLNVPSYKMSPLIEQAYLEDPIRSCIYTDHYFFTIPFRNHIDFVEDQPARFLYQRLVILAQLVHDSLRICHRIYVFIKWRDINQV